MILNQLDLGGSHPYAVPLTGQTIGIVEIEGYETVAWPLGSMVRKQTVVFWLQEWQSIGGAAAKSLAATQYLVKQVEELASNRDMQPCYIQWTATAQPGAALNASELHDGWYVIDEFAPDYSNFIVSGIVKCKLTVTEVAPSAPRRVSVAYSGGALSTNFSGAALNLISLPSASISAGDASFLRTGGEGTIPSILSPIASPEPAVLSAPPTFQGAVHVFDSIA